MLSRFAPSPTGLLHLGNIRTALFNYLAAKAVGGKFLLRVEDTDAERSKSEYLQCLLRDLRALGLHWDLGPGIDDARAPFIQSERRSLHERYLEQLRQRQLIYPCFCTEAQLKLARKRHLGQGEAPRYDGTCAHLTEAEIARRRQAGQQAAWRLRVANDATIEFTDLVRGQQRYHGHELGDFIVQKSDGSLAFMFANALDDALMGVSHVLRGEDHLSNTPRQLYILRLLELPQPLYGHISLITGSDGAPLSKRNGSQALPELLATGYLPIALVNYLARLGATLSSNDLLPLDGLAANFQLDSLVKSSARYDPGQLNYWQKQAVMQLDAQQLSSWLQDAIAQSSDPQRAQALLGCLQANIVFPHEYSAWLEDLLLFKPLPPEAQQDIDQVGWPWVQQVLKLLQQKLEYPQLLSSARALSSAKGKYIFKSLRWLMTSRSSGPELAAIYSALGNDFLSQRVDFILRNH